VGQGGWWKLLLAGWGELSVFLVGGTAVEISEIRAGIVYVTARDQRRRVVRITGSHLLYEIIADSPPFYRVSVFTRTFAADVVSVQQTHPT
jgi:hypothetical protein